MQDKKQKEVKVLQNELNRINADIERIVEAIAKAPLESLIEKLQVLENQKNGLKENINKIVTCPDKEPRLTSHFSEEYTVCYAGSLIT